MPLNHFKLWVCVFVRNNVVVYSIQSTERVQNTGQFCQSKHFFIVHIFHLLSVQLIKNCLSTVSNSVFTSSFRLNYFGKFLIRIFLTYWIFELEIFHLVFEIYEIIIGTTGRGCEQYNIIIKWIIKIKNYVQTIWCDKEINSKKFVNQCSLI